MSEITNNNTPLSTPPPITYLPGHPVWAQLEGFPWWPAKIIEPTTLPPNLRPSTPSCRCERLVQFFNDRGRTAKVHFCRLRPFTDWLFDELDKHAPSPALKKAIAEAERYALDGGFKMEREGRKRKMRRVEERRAEECVVGMCEGPQMVRSGRDEGGLSPVLGKREREEGGLGIGGGLGVEGEVEMYGRMTREELITVVRGKDLELKHRGRGYGGIDRMGLVVLVVARDIELRGRGK